MAGDDAELRALQRRAYGARGDALTPDETRRLTALEAARRDPQPTGSDSQLDDLPPATETAVPTGTAPSAAAAPPGASPSSAPKSPAVALPVEAGPPRRKRWITVALAAAVVLVAGAGGWLLRGGPALPAPLEPLAAQYDLVRDVAPSFDMEPSTLTMLGSVGESDLWVARSADRAQVCSFIVPRETTSESASAWPLSPRETVATTCGSSADPLEISAIAHFSGAGTQAATVTSSLFWPPGQPPLVTQDVVAGTPGTSVTVLANDVGAELMDTVLIDPSAIAARVPQMPGATVQLAGVINGASVWAVKANDGSGAYCGVFARVDRATGDVSVVAANCGAGSELELTTPTVSYTDPQTAVVVLDGASLTGFRLYLVWQGGEATVAIRPA